MRYKLTYVYGDSDQKFTQTFSSKVLMESYIETGKDKDLRVINIEGSKLYGYAMVSSKEQNLDRQIEALKDYGINERDIIIDKQSGKGFNREGYKKLKEQLLRSGDVLVIKELDRLGRNMAQIKEEWNYLQSKEINIVVLDTPILNTEGKSNLEKTLISNIVFELLIYISEKERVKIKQRQAEGIANAKAKGKHLGRPRIEYPGNFKEVYDKWKSKEITGVKAMELMNLKKNSFYNLIKKYEIKKEI